MNLCQETGTSPLFIACQEGHDSIVQHLLNNGADVDLCIMKGDNPLRIARQKGYESIEQILLKNVANEKTCIAVSCSL